MVSSAEILDGLLFEMAPDALLACNEQGLVVRANRAATALFGDFPGETRPMESVFSSENSITFGQLIRSTERIVECVCRDARGREFPASLTAGRVFHEDSLLHLISLRDVTATKQTARELQARARQQSVVSELGRLAVSGMDVVQLMTHAVELLREALEVEYANVLELLPDGQVVFRAGAGWNKDLVGLGTVAGIEGIPAADVFFHQAPVIVADLRVDPRFPGASLLREHGVISSLNVGLQGLDRPFGALGVHSTQPDRFHPEDVSFVQAVAHVLSAALERNWLEQRQRERYLQRAEQMAALGQVAAGIAHELRNPLTAIKGLIQVNLRKAATRRLPTEDLAVIEHEIRRMERTLQTFLDFARPPKLDRRELSLHELIERVFSLTTGRARKQQVELRFSSDNSPAVVLGDEDQLQQLLLNLVLNALDAMPHGGIVHVELRSTENAAVELSVRDTGPGIAPHILPKVFETFVSSKETGVGLGLPVSRRIAEDHGGSLSAYNLPGGGACFVVKLPVLVSDPLGNSHANPARGG